MNVGDVIQLLPLHRLRAIAFCRRIRTSEVNRSSLTTSYEAATHNEILIGKLELKAWLRRIVVNHVLQYIYDKKCEIDPTG
jgi:hypothetical protein